MLVLEFVAAERRQTREGERLLGSSEVLEAIIGKFKHVAGERGQHGLTGMVLSIGALVGHLAVATVQSATTETTTNDVWSWCRLHLGATVHRVRQRIRQALHPELAGELEIVRRERQSVQEALQEAQGSRDGHPRDTQATALAHHGHPCVL